MLNGMMKLTQMLNFYVLVCKKDELTATCKLCNKDITVAHMGFGALKQNSKKKVHVGLSADLVEAHTPKQMGSVKKLTVKEVK